MTAAMSTPSKRGLLRSSIRLAEEHGLALRKVAGLDLEGKLNPFDHLDTFNVELVSLDNLPGLADADVSALASLDARTWSGGAQELPDGKLLVVLNPNQTRERAAITLMEEVAHRYLGHKPSKLIHLSPSESIRKYDSSIENEAFWAAAAALLPSRVVARAVWTLKSADALAAEYGASKELVEFRIKILRLWAHYRVQRLAA